MTNHVLVLMKAMPPTIGHRRLLEFAQNIGWTEVIMDVKSDEPMIEERYNALRRMLPGGRVGLVRMEEQDPEAPGFWDAWDKALAFGKGHFTHVVASEPYGAEVARRLGARFIPYDPDRELCVAKAEYIRWNPLIHFSDIDREFQPYLRTKVTVWGAESTGKTTLTKQLAWNLVGARYIFEYARPYLETVGPDIDVLAMENIWTGQLALQEQAMLWDKFPILIQDTDLYSTIGYWEQPHWQEALGPVPEQLIKDAERTKSDLYIITRADIPFEPDSIRYGENQRESSDEYWIGIAEKYGLNYVILESSPEGRIYEACSIIRTVSNKKLEKINYDRRGF